LEDGRLVVCTHGGAVLWSSIDHGGLSAAHYNNGRLWVRNDGKLFVQTGNGVTWSTDPEEVWRRETRGASLRAGQSLAPGQWLESTDGRCTLAFGIDGGLSMSRVGGGGWWARISGGWIWRMVLQDDGELVVRDRAGAALWRSTDGGGRSGPQYAGSAL